jgi:hypothetical protein
MKALAAYAGAERRTPPVPRPAAAEASAQAMARLRAGIIVETCFQLAAREARLPVAELRVPKSKAVAPWRFAALFLAAEAAGLTRYQIALHTGMDRTAIAHGIKRCRALMEGGGAYFLSVDALRGEIVALYGAEASR